MIDMKEKLSRLRRDLGHSHKAAESCNPLTHGSLKAIFEQQNQRLEDEIKKIELTQKIPVVESQETPKKSKMKGKKRG